MLAVVPFATRSSQKSITTPTGAKASRTYWKKFGSNSSVLTSVKLSLVWPSGRE